MKCVFMLCLILVISSFSQDVPKLAISTNPLGSMIFPLFVDGYFFKINVELPVHDGKNSIKGSVSLTKINYENSSFELDASMVDVELRYLFYKNSYKRGFYSGPAIAYSNINRIGDKEYDEEDEKTVLLSLLYYLGYRWDLGKFFINADVGGGLTIGLVTESDESDNDTNGEFQVLPWGNLDVEFGMYLF